jgi:phage shock protein PspC (stress-responsive transcriptional regulator)
LGHKYKNDYLLKRTEKEKDERSERRIMHVAGVCGGIKNI